MEVTAVYMACGQNDMIALLYYIWCCLMSPETILKFNRINQKFYQQVAQPFHKTRERPWSGWQRLLPILEKKRSTTLNVLDLGCGNGRFGLFLAQSLPSLTINYTGIDSNTELLSLAHTALDQRVNSLQLIKADLVSDLLESHTPIYFDQHYDLVVAFGVLHHIPSFQLRRTLIKQAEQLCSPGGYLVFTAWQFLTDTKLAEKIIDPKLFDIDPTLLETHDFILSWERDVTAYRYCHFVNEAEIKQLFTPPTGLRLFKADGKSHQLNIYVIKAIT